jgi:hypothetical protein
MARLPQPGEPEPSAPIRSAGITPAPSIERGGAVPRAQDREAAE